MVATGSQKPKPQDLQADFSFTAFPRQFIVNSSFNDVFSRKKQGKGSTSQCPFPPLHSSKGEIETRKSVHATSVGFS